MAFDDLTVRLERAYADLESLLENRAPELFRELQEKPPVVVPDPGYQVLPELLPDLRAPTDDSRLFFNSYSWPKTRALILERQRRLAELIEQLLAAARPRGAEERVRLWTSMVSEYKQLREDHVWIEGLISHNHLWQGQVAENPALFRRGTRLHGLAVERQAILDRLAVASDEEAPALRRREQEILTALRAAGGRTWSPDYLQVESPSPGSWLIRVPVYTDLEDSRFLDRFESIVERYWRLEEEGAEYRVELVMKAFDGLASRPEPGEPVDLASHPALFPPDGAILTTGGEKIHTRGRCIVLGPEAVAPRTLAHEFGHVLGFQDTYVRGYRDLGAEGYEILEASPDPQDIMCSSGTGWVLRHHFEDLIRSPESSRTHPGSGAESPPGR